MYTLSTFLIITFQNIIQNIRKDARAIGLQGYALTFSSVNLLVFLYIL